MFLFFLYDLSFLLYRTQCCRSANRHGEICLNLLLYSTSQFCRCLDQVRPLQGSQSLVSVWGGGGGVGGCSSLQLSGDLEPGESVAAASIQAVAPRTALEDTRREWRSFTVCGRLKRHTFEGKWKFWCTQLLWNVLSCSSLKAFVDTIFLSFSIKLSSLSGTQRHVGKRLQLYWYFPDKSLVQKSE